MIGLVGRTCVFTIAFGLAGASAATVTGLGLSKRDANAPIQVSSDRFDADFNSKSGLYSGNVVVIQGDFRLRADKVRVNVVAGKPDKILANDNVVFDAPSGHAQGDSGIYDVTPRVITLNGHVILAKEKNVMRGTTLTVNLLTGEAQLGAKGMPGGRVQSLFTPPPQSTTPPQPSAPKPNP